MSRSPARSTREATAGGRLRSSATGTSIAAGRGPLPLPCCHARDSLQRSFIACQEPGSARQAGGDPRVEPRERRQHFVAHPVAGKRGVCVRRIEDEVLHAHLQVREDLRARHVEQRAHDHSPARAHGAEAAAARAAQQAQQQRFRLVVLVVADQHEARAAFGGGAAQERIALAPRCRLESSPVARRPRRDVGARGVQRHAELRAQPRAESGVLRRLGPQAMVEVRGVHRNLALVGDRQERVEERDRVGASRQSDDYRTVADAGKAQRAPGGGDHGAARARRRDQGRGMVAVQGLEPRTPRI